MDKDTISSISETPKVGGGMGRHSTEERNIRGSPSSSASSGKPLPKYLRASTGSCHDFCKYGKKQAFEEETKHQFLRKLGKSGGVMGRKQLVKDNLNEEEEERRKKALIKTKSSSFRRGATSDTPGTVNRFRHSLSDGELSKEKPAKNDMLPQEEIVLKEPALISASLSIKRGQKIEEKVDDRKTQAVKPKTPVHRNTSTYKSGIATEINEQKDLLPDDESDPQRKSTASTEKNVSGLQRDTALIKPRLVGQTSVKSNSTSYKPEISKQKPLTPLKTVVTAAKLGISLKAIKTSVAMPGSPLTPSRGSSGTSRDGDKTSRLADNPKVVAKRGLKPSRTYSPKVINRNATTTKNRGNVKCKQDDEKDEEKRAYINEMKPNDADSSCPQSKEQNTQISDEMPLPEKVSLNSLEKELLAPRSDDMYLPESEKVDLDCQQKKKLNNDQGYATDNCQKKQETNGDQSFSSVLENKEESENLHQQQAKDDQSSSTVLDSRVDVANCDQKKIDINQVSEDDLSSQSISENDAETDNCQKQKSSDASQTSTNDHSASDDGNTDETNSARTESSQSEMEYEGSESNKNEERRTSRRTALASSEDNYSSPHKLKFRRGKVVELQPESKGPRRLKFRRARVISDGGGGGGGGTHQRRHLRRNEMDDVLPDDPNPPAETVVLRHKDAQEKKDSQGLFNNVIEETASKLVETRKSKVKALVGAFETVISLQDGKSTSTT